VTYDEFLAAAAALCVVPVDDADFLAIIPQVIADAEGRIYNDIDMLATRASNATHLLAVGNRNITLASGEFLTVDRINIVTPAGATSPDAAGRAPLTATSPEFLDAVYNSSTTSGQPAYWAIRSETSIIVGPWPNGNYVAEIFGTSRPAALSSGNQTTPITRDMPDLFLNAAMTFLSGWQRNFGAQADDPKMGLSWEAKYQSSLAGWRGQEARKKLEAAGWSSRPPAPAAGAPRA